MGDNGFYQEALDWRGSNIIGKTDGWATASPPDKYDWITDCESEVQI